MSYFVKTDSVTGRHLTDDQQMPFHMTWEHFNPNDWNFRSGSTGTLSVQGGGAFGGRVLRAQGPVWIAWKHNIPYDPAKLYKLTVRVRVFQEPTNGQKNFYSGFDGVQEDGITYINGAGVSGSTSSQHYGPNAVAPPTSTTTWTVYTYYWKGCAATGVTAAGGSIDQNAPGNANNLVRYFRPLLILNWTAGDGITEVDSISVEEMGWNVPASHIETSALRLVHPDQTDSATSRRIGYPGLTLSTHATDSGVVNITKSITKNDALTKAFHGLLLRPTINAGAGNTSTTFDVLTLDTVNTGMTGVTVNSIINAKYGGADRMRLDSTGHLQLSVGGESFSLRGGPTGGSDHAYMSFYARAGSSARSAWFGYGAVGTNDLSLKNEIAGGAIKILSGGAANGTGIIELNTSGADIKLSTSGGTINARDSSAITLGRVDAVAGAQTVYLDFGGTTNLTGTVAAHGDAARLIRWSDGRTELYHRGLQDFLIRAVDGAALKLKTNDTDRLTIASSGAATFSSSVATTLLYVNDATPAISFTSTGGTANQKRWAMSAQSSGATFVIGAINDNWSSELTALTVSRSGTVTAADSFVSKALWLGNHTNPFVAFTANGGTPDARLWALQTSGTGSEMQFNAANDAWDSVTTAMRVGRTGVVTAARFEATSTSGAGDSYKVGDDAWVGDIHASNTVGVKGQQSGGTTGFIRFGNSNTGLGNSGNDLVYGTNKVMHAGIANVDYATPSYVQSRGMNLVTNGFGNLGTNYNFSGFTFDQVEVYSGLGSYKDSTRDAGRFSDEFIPVDPGKFYEVRVWAKSNGVAGPKCYIGGIFFDADGYTIDPWFHVRRAGTDTTLAAPLKPGDTTVTLTSSANWYATTGGNTSNAHMKSIVVYGYKNSKGYLYPNYTYSRYIVTDAWADGGINTTTHVITLRAPWPADRANPAAGDGAWPIGTAVSNAASGGTYKYFVAANVSVPATWTEYRGVIGQTDLSGGNIENMFPPAAASMKLVFLNNLYADGGVVNYSAVWMSEANASQITGKRNATIFTTGDDLTLSARGQSAKISAHFTDTNTTKNFIYATQGTGNNDPQRIVFETGANSVAADNNKGVIHIQPSDDNDNTNDYVAIHGINQTESIKLYTGGNIVTTGVIYNNGLYSGSSTNPLTMVSQMADGATAVGSIINTQAPYTTAGSLLLAVRNNGASRFSVAYNGDTTAWATSHAAGFWATGTGGSLTAGASRALIQGTPTDGATAVGVTINSVTNLANATAKIVSFTNAGAEKAYITKDGGAQFNSTVNVSGTINATAFIGPLASQDTRNTNHEPDDRGSGLWADFKNNTTDGLADGGSFHGVLTFRPYGTAADFSGGPAYQLAFTENTKLWLRKSTSATAWGAWTEAGGSSTGTVTSVGLAAHSMFSVTGSPITTNGTISLGLAAQPINTVLAAPSSGAAQAPTFRVLVNEDLPVIDATRHGAQGGGTLHADVVAGGASGFMTGTDKTKLDGIAASANNYTHPANHPPSIITQDASNRFVTDAEKTAWNAKQGSLGYTPVNKVGDTMTGALSFAVAGSTFDTLIVNANTYERFRLKCESTGNTGLELGSNQGVLESGTGTTTYIDFHASSVVSQTDFAARIQRSGGVNGTFDLINLGTGNFNVTLNGTTRLAINGSTGMMTVTDMTSTSDGRLKTDVRDFEVGPLLQPRRYKWKADGREDIGFIAQEVEAIYPELVASRMVDGEEQLAVNYQKAVVILAAQVKQLTAELRAIKAKMGIE